MCSEFEHQDMWIAPRATLLPPAEPAGEPEARSPLQNIDTGLL